MPTTRGMRGGGYYDAHSEYQRDAAASTASLIADAVGAMDLPPAGEPFVVVDYGAAEGGNSVAAITGLLTQLRGRSGEDARQAVVVHNDLRTNDWNGLFAAVGGPHGYIRNGGEGRVIPMASVTSFYDPVVPDGTASFGVSFSAAHWLSRLPGSLQAPDGLYFCDVGNDARVVLEKQAASDWKRFVARRAEEIRIGGRLLVVTVGSRRDPDHPGELLVSARDLLRLMDRVARQLVTAGRLDEDAYARFAFPVVARTPEQARAGFDPERWQLDVCDTFDVPNPYWAAYERDGDAAAYAKQYAAFVRAFAESALVTGLFGPGATDGGASALSDTFFARLTELIAADPEASRFRDWSLTVLATRI
jgi:hypothetical protein